MRAQVLTAVGPLTPGSQPLRLVDRPAPTPAADEVLIRVAACGVCHTELDEIEGRTAPSALPRVLGHQVVGRVEAVGASAAGVREGDRVGVAWIFRACGHCEYCRADLENLCPDFVATGRDVDGGYADYMTAPAAFTHPIPSSIGDTVAAPLLCAGAIGHRSLMLAALEDGEPLGLTGFGASAHLVVQLARHRYPRSPVFVFARDPKERDFARALGAAWAGATEDTPPTPMAAVIDTTPAWTPDLAALRHLAPAGRLVINAIRKEDRDKDAWLRLDYARDLWMEKSIKSVANVTRRDVREMLAAAAAIPIAPSVRTFPLEQANEALRALKERQSTGAIVLTLAPAS